MSTVPRILIIDDIEPKHWPASARGEMIEKDTRMIVIGGEIERPRWSRADSIDFLAPRVESSTYAFTCDAMTTSSEPARKPHVNDRSYFRHKFGQQKP